MSGQEIELRCFCARSPLLGVAGVDSRGRGYVHIKTWRAKRIYAEVLVLGGGAMVRCRECYRWHRFQIRTGEPVRLEPAEVPEDIAI